MIGATTAARNWALTPAGRCTSSGWDAPAATQAIAGRGITTFTTPAQRIKARPGARRCALRWSPRQLPRSLSGHGRRAGRQGDGGISYARQRRCLQAAGRVDRERRGRLDPDAQHGEWLGHLRQLCREYYGGDSAGSVAYDPVAGRFVIAVVDRSNGYSPRIFTTALNLFMPRTFLPVVLNEP